MRNESPRRPILSRRDALAGGSAAALAATMASAPAAEGSTVRVAYPAAAATLDPAKMRVGGLDYNYARGVFSRLTAQDDITQVLPDLATSWEATEDLKTWIFHLRPGVKFHDGKPLDAADVVFTYNRLLDPAIGSVLRASLGAVGKVEAVDPLTVKFTMKVPYADMPAVAAGYQAQIVSEAHVATLTTKPIGTGPFRFVEYRPGDQLVLEKNPDYFLPGVPKIDRAILRVIPEFTTAVAGLESGSVEIVYDLPPEQQDQLKNSSVARVDAVTSGHWGGIIFNNEFKPSDDPRVREALIKLVDRQALTDIATFGYGIPTVTPIPPNHPFFRKDLLTPPDVAGAKKLLAAAGLSKGFPIEMYLGGSDPTAERLATAFRDSAKQLGIAVSLRIVPPDKFFAEMEGKVPFNIDGFFGRSTPDLMTYAWYHSSGSWNNTLWHYKNAEVDKLLDTARSTTDKAEQAKLYGRFQEIVAKDGPGCLVFVKNFACGVSKKVQGFKSSPLMWADVSHVTISA
ncbi:ABC transporter substrate-binding protein [Rhodopila sp.]|uniref:ABC transporter substrate-binding protein n=1 Tax=Rhodopila sp. TaxID=2480087 RepID=UPI003D102125